ncbi:hypothetical protein N8703_01790 [Verrucomicrobia bacterium]|nr:hypothetical protein [Verrucomicrobiota bacterium]
MKQFNHRGDTVPSSIKVWNGIGGRCYTSGLNKMRSIRGLISEKPQGSLGVPVE